MSHLTLKSDIFLAALRDHFASLAMQAFIPRIFVDDPGFKAPDHSDIAEWAYEIADAMLEARKPKETK